MKYEPLDDTDITSIHKLKQKKKKLLDKLR